MIAADLKLRVYPTGIISKNLAWRVAAKIGKAAPYRGYSLDLENGQMLSALPNYQFEIKFTAEEQERRAIRNEALLQP